MVKYLRGKIMFKIGNVEIKNNVVLAPMAGISNPAYIKICEEMGLAYAITELISSEAVFRNNKKTMDMLNGFNDLNIPVAIQLFGSNTEVMGRAARIIVDTYHPKIIDINMGCPVPKVAVKSEAGAALMKDLDKVYNIVNTVVRSVNVPVSVKIRSGWDNNSINAVEVAKMCEKAGASAISIHGRTRSQGYSGSTSLDIIKAVKESVSIPVIGNGDIRSIESAKKMIEYTNCDAVMIGRAALGNPWLIRNIVNYFNKGNILDEPSYVDRVMMCFKHLDYLMKYKCEKVAVLEMRSHISWYLRGMPGAQEIKNSIFKTKNSEEIKNILSNYLKNIKNNI